MTDPPRHDRAPEETDTGGDDPTRDIRLPPLPGRPPSAMPAGWAAAAPSAAPQDGSASFDQPTDQHGAPGGRPRERTIAFAAPQMAQGRPKPTVGPVRRRPPRAARPPRPRRWPWVVLTLLPILVIVGAGITWVLLLRAA